MKTLKEYEVVWRIQLDATSPREAAEKALKYQRDRGSDAVVFEVREFDNPDPGVGFTTIDLNEEEEGDE